MLLCRAFVLIFDESQDMWHAYNLSFVGVVLKSTTIRFVFELFVLQLSLLIYKLKDYFASCFCAFCCPLLFTMLILASLHSPAGLQVAFFNTLLFQYKRCLVRLFQKCTVICCCCVVQVVCCNFFGVIVNTFKQYLIQL